MLTKKQEDSLFLEFFKISCNSIKPENPLRVAVSLSYLVDVLNATEKYLRDFDDVMITAGKRKKEGLDTTGLVEKIVNLQSDLQMHTDIARLKIGKTQLDSAKPGKEINERSGS